MDYKIWIKGLYRWVQLSKELHFTKKSLWSFVQRFVKTLLQESHKNILANQFRLTNYVHSHNPQYTFKNSLILPVSLIKYIQKFINTSRTSIF